MKSKLSIFLIFFLVFVAFGNDGAYISRGGVIYPIQETRISLEKEILSFRVKEGIAFVDIQFQFYNPENVERKLLVGFQAPSSYGDVSYSDLNGIRDFKIIQGGKMLPYRIKAAECENCELKSPEELNFSSEDSGIYVYLFEITFKPGLNEINHSYNFPASSDVMTLESYEYILTTGAKWAGGKIKDLTVNIDMGQNKYFYVNDIFGSKANWSILGDGKISGGVRILNGTLQIKVSDFQPLKNISFGISNVYMYQSDPLNPNVNQEGKIVNLEYWEPERNYSKQELRIMRNAVFAQYGYVFKSPDLYEYFDQFAWYIPNPNLNIGDIVLTKEEKDFVDKIVKMEKR